MKRRSFLSGIALGVLAMPRVAETQPAAKVWRIGYLGGGSPATTPSEPFVQELRRLGWNKGQNLAIQYRWAEGGADRLYDLGREMVALNMDVIVVSAPSSSASLVVPTRTTPVVTSTFDRPMGAPSRAAPTAASASPTASVPGKTPPGACWTAPAPRDRGSGKPLRLGRS